MTVASTSADAPAVAATAGEPWLPAAVAAAQVPGEEVAAWRRSQPAYVIAPAGELLRVWGRDAQAFLQTKLTQDTRGWTESGGAPAAAVDVTGKLLFHAECWRVGPEEFWLRIHGDAEAAAAHLDKYLISERVTLEAISGLHSAALHVTCEQRSAFVAADAGVGDGRSGWLAAGARWASTASRGASVIWVTGEADAVGSCVEAWHRLGAERRTQASRDAFEVMGMGARLGREFGPHQVIPNEVGLWESMSFRKGCYLGQEVIERLFSRGSPSKRLVSFVVPRPVYGPAALMLGVDVVGWTVAAASDGSEHRVAAFMRRAFLQQSEPAALEGVLLGQFTYVGGERPERV